MDDNKPDQLHLPENTFVSISEPPDYSSQPLAESLAQQLPPRTEKMPMYPGFSTIPTNFSSAKINSPEALIQFQNNFWQSHIGSIEDNMPDFKMHLLPLARIKKVMKSDPDVKVQMISAEAPILFSKACEIFITELTQRAWMNAEENKRRTLQRQDVSCAAQRSEMFDFLIDIVPREEFANSKRPGTIPPAPHSVAIQGEPDVKEESQAPEAITPSHAAAVGVTQQQQQNIYNDPAVFQQYCAQNLADASMFSPAATLNRELSDQQQQQQQQQSYYQQQQQQQSIATEQFQWLQSPPGDMGVPPGSQPLQAPIPSQFVGGPPRVSTPGTTISISAHQGIPGMQQQQPSPQPKQEQ